MCGPESVALWYSSVRGRTWAAVRSRETQKQKQKLWKNAKMCRFALTLAMRSSPNGGSLVRKSLVKARAAAPAPSSEEANMTPLELPSAFDPSFSAVSA